MSITDEADDTTSAIDTSDDQPSPPISTDNSQGQPPAQGQTPAPNQLPDVGPPPAMNELATETTGQFGSDAGDAFKRDNAQGVQNLQQSGPGQLAKRVIAYLSGEGGNPAGALRGAAAVKQVAPHLSDGDAALVSIDNTAKTKGIQAAFDELQGHRVAYNAKMAFGKVAAEGISGKPANIASAVDAANKAMMHMPDGANVHFQSSQGGVTATVKMPGTSQVHQIPLSTDQFKQFLDVGGAGQWDKVHAQGTPAALQALARPAAAAPAPASGKDQSRAGDDDDQEGPSVDPTAAQSGPQVNSDDKDDQDEAPRSAFGETADQLTPDGHRPWIPPRSGAYSNRLENQAAMRYPSIGENNERQDFMASQTEKEAERQNKVDQAAEKGKWADKRAATTGGFRNQGEEIKAKGGVDKAHVFADSRVEQGRQKLQAAIAAEEGKNGRSQAANAMRGLDALVASGQLNKMNPAQKAFWEKMTTAPQAPTPQAAAPTGQPQAGGTPQRARFADGKYYVKGPDGKAKLDPNQNP